MQSLWNDNEAQEFTDDLGLRVYSSRLLGRDPSLVLHGGGNTSVKLVERDIFGRDQELLYVKGSGWDLESIDRPGFAPVKLAHLRELATLETLSDPRMVNELKTHMTLASAPTPSVEAILHAVLPYKFVDHTHADAVVTICNTPSGRARIEEIYADSVVVIPYVMPGFDLARTCARLFAEQAGERTLGMVLMNHGVFSFGATARESYERMIDLVSRAEDYLRAHAAWDLREAPPLTPSDELAAGIAALRAELSDMHGEALILRTQGDARSAAFVQRDDLESIAGQGPATPDHVIRTKRLPMIGRDIHAYAREYRAYFERHAANARDPKTILDAAPRVILDARLGMCAAGRSVKEANIVRDIYRHTMDIIERASALESWRALPAQDIFDVEYWDLEQDKLRKGGSPPEFGGEVALITGAASGIGRACAASLLARGAAVVGLDRDAAIAGTFDNPAWLGIECDVTRPDALRAALTQTLYAFGGLDMLILNAGVFPGGCRIDSLEMAEWRRVLDVNLDANLMLMQLAYPVLKLSPRKGRVVVIGSKNLRAPGAGAAAYSASKAALNQLMRIAAMEWAEDGIRINAVHPDAVFDTAIWTEQVLQKRAAYYGMTVEAYKQRNLLKVEITSHDVAEIVADLCGERYAKTTAAHIPIDGGDPRVI